MKQAVFDAWFAYTSPLEGVVKWPYLDLKNLVSIGIGDLIDPIGLALGLPFVKPDGTRATAIEIANAWQAVKQHPGGGTKGYLDFENVTNLRLTDQGVRDLVLSKLASDEAYLKKHFTGFDSWPADAQLGALSMAWAVGPAFWDPHISHPWPKLTHALDTCDFATASIECFMPEEKVFGGLRKRNVADKILFANAAIVFTDPELNPEMLYWPRVLKDEVPTEPAPIVDALPDEPDPESTA